MRQEKKRLLIGSFLFGVAITAVACSSAPASPTEAPPGQEAQQEHEAAGSGGEQSKRYYESVRGKIELPDGPPRVVVANRDYVGDVLALDIEPVGVSSTMVFDTPYYKELLNGVEGIGEDGASSLEKIISLEPNLIFTYQEDAYENLSKIASTILMPYGMYDYDERLLEIGKIMDRETEARQRLELFDQKVEVKKQELSGKVSPDSKVAIIEISDKDLYLFGKTYGRGGEIVYNQLGLSAPEMVEDATSEHGWASISLETLPDFLGEADYILLGVREAGRQRKTEIESSALWTGLPAVQAGNVYEYNLQEFYFQDVIALEYQLDLLSDFFLAD
ncbi:ABC transporter substrate-binding protein [Paenibacillus senegalensis]|uniref:ABC transporter substrate-binding protein n=1 Tax=Paenibacillus senegalensis TaxID=1465766 RepID=UPI000288E3FA|nr:ABC transporter substrate-binding protein [Paenibacillus senegalensis]